MSVLASQVVDWAALGKVAYISAISGLAIALVLGVGIVSSLRAQDHKGTSAALGFNAVTVVSVLLVAGAIVLGIYYITDK
jgi:hypothetical protein